MIISSITSAWVRQGSIMQINKHYLISWNKISSIISYLWSNYLFCHRKHHSWVRWSDIYHLICIYQLFIEWQVSIFTYGLHLLPGIDTSSDKETSPQRNSSASLIFLEEMRRPYRECLNIASHTPYREASIPKFPLQASIATLPYIYYLQKIRMISWQLYYGALHISPGNVVSRAY